MKKKKVWLLVFVCIICFNCIIFFRQKQKDQYLDECIKKWEQIDIITTKIEGGNLSEEELYENKIELDKLREEAKILKEKGQ